MQKTAPTRASLMSAWLCQEGGREESLRGHRGHEQGPQAAACRRAVCLCVWFNPTKKQL